MRLKGTVVPGHGVASGAAYDPRFPRGTLALQLPIFSRLGLDVSSLHPGTVNVSLGTPPRLPGATHTFRRVRWHPDVPPEDFSFYAVTIEHEGTRSHGYLYRPHPETKPDHQQPDDVIELICPRLRALKYGDTIFITFTD